jgi:hypothetical protein
METDIFTWIKDNGLPIPRNEDEWEAASDAFIDELDAAENAAHELVEEETALTESAVILPFPRDVTDEQIDDAPWPEEWPETESVPEAWTVEEILAREG